MIKLDRMTAQEYADYSVGSIKEYAREHVRAGDWTPEEAQARAEKSFAELLPQGVESKDHYLFTLRDGETQARVGMIWFALRPGRLQPAAFIYDFLIEPGERRKGYGRQALAAVEQEARAAGAGQIELHVFGHNPGAIALYQSAGFETTHLMMAKKLSA